MKRVGSILLLLLAALPVVHAQVTVEVKLEQDQFLPGESIPLAVRVTNRSGQSLTLGNQENWLTFSVENRDGSGIIVDKTGEVPVLGEFVLGSSMVATKRVDVAPYFNFGYVGRYAITATVRIPAWDREISSRPRVFQLISGAKLWEREFGVPTTSEGPPEVRRYLLQQANYIRGQLRLYLRITDGSGIKSFKVIPIGTILSFSRPDPQVDKNSNLHLLYQNGPQSFSYSIYNPEGELLTRDTYDYVGSRPRLKMDEEGGVKVVGGVRRERKDEEAGAETNAPPVLDQEKAPDS